ncbi:hypothetical protein [Kosmotoga pacifica]|uniref:Uncharacterized protein n=1 Tax=Kosmotoga pacifica TaxID=1330330 RepID=A0A0G2ZBU9_9BACT|nr:hypothetical protein [Kosmotoga pacifica]AKI97029.1 hypothetical protein IX53_03420 [Kosmotoga pacifica]
MRKILLLTILALTILGNAKIIIDKIDTSEFPEVHLNVLTTGFYSSGDFMLSEDGVMIKPLVKLLEREPLKVLKIYYFLDVSGSMNDRLESIIRQLSLFSRAVEEFFEGEVINTLIAVSDVIIEQLQCSALEIRDRLIELYSLTTAADEDLGHVLSTYSFEEGALVVIVDDEDSWKSDPTLTLEESGIPFIALKTGSENAKKLARVTYGLVFDESNLSELERLISEFSRSWWEFTYTSPFPYLSVHTIEIGGEKKNYFTLLEHPLIFPEEETVKATAGENLTIKGVVTGEIMKFEAYYGDELQKAAIFDNEYRVNFIPETGIKKLTLRACSVFRCTEKAVTIIGIETQPALKVELSWSEPYVDLDLYIIEPSKSVYFLNSSNIGILDTDSQSGPGKEVYLLDPKEKIPPSGDYKVRVHYYRGETPINFRVVIYSYGRVIADETFQLEKSNPENCSPEATGADWLDVINLKF